MLENTLKEIGLSPTEAKVYIALLSMKLATIPELCEHTSLPRTSISYGCEQLAQKSLATKIKRNKHWYFSPSPPSTLQTTLDMRRQEIDKQSTHLSSILGKLVTIYRENKITPQIQSFEGPQGIIHMMEDVLRDKQPIYGALNLNEDLHPLLSDFFKNSYHPQRIKSQVPAKMLFNDNERTRNYRTKDKPMNRISMLVPEKEFPFDICFHIYGNKIALYSYKYPSMSGVIIQDHSVRQMHMSLFKLAWKTAQSMPINEKYKDIDLD